MRLHDDPAAFSLNLLLALCAGLALTACYVDPLGSEDVAPDLHTIEIDEAVRSFPAQDLFAEAGAEYGVPADLLAAIGWKQSSFAPGADDHDEHAPAHGWMGLTPDHLALAAEVTGLSAEAIAHEREENVYGAAAVLSALRATEAPGANPNAADASWYEVVVAYPGFETEWLAHGFAKDVFLILQRGLAVPTGAGAEDLVQIGSRDLPDLAYVRTVEAPTSDGTAFHGTKDYPGAARFSPAHSSNQSSRSGGASSIRRVVIHTVEGSYGGAISWFQNPSANVSAHYVVRKSDGEVTQMVRDSKKAWHVCGSNNDTIGIEHEGAASNAATWTPAIIDASARLTAWLVNEYNIPIDRDHIVGHGEIQGAGCAYRYDPGTHFPWDAYMAKVSAYAVGSSPVAEAPDELPPGELPTGPETLPSTSSVAFQSPRDGDVIGNPVMMRIVKTNAHHVDVFAGPYRIARDLVASPVHVGVPFSQLGERTLTAKAYSASGALLATDTVTVTVTHTSGTLNPSATSAGGMTYTMSATASTADVSYVRYWVDGWPLTDIGNGSQRAPAPSFALDYTFSHAAYGRQLVARGYDTDGNLITEGFNYIDVNPGAATSTEEITAVDTQPAGGTIMYLRSSATPGVAFIEYYVDGWKLPDMNTGETYGVPLDYSLWYEFNYWGERNLEVRAYDAAWNLVDTWTQTIQVPSPALEVSWQRLGYKSYRFDGDAPAGTAKVVIEIDGWALPDKASGDQWAVGPDFILNYDFNYGGYRELHAQALDSAGNVLDTYTTNIQVY
mgnify:FL=1